MADTDSKFAYVRKPTGEISGASFLQQTEDAINHLANQFNDSANDATEALRIAQQAKTTADTASANATEVLQIATSTTGTVATLPSQVEAFNGRLTIAESNANSALQDATSANTKSTEALSTANAASSNANSALQKATTADETSQTALTNSQQALNTANQAKIDAAEDIKTMEGLVQSAQTAESNASSSSSSAGESATLALNASTLAEKWATWTSNSAEPGEEPDYTVDGTEYSAKWYAQKSGESATAAASSASAAGAFASSAATSASTATTQAGTATTKASEAATSASNAASAASAAQSAQTAAETARDQAQEAASANQYAVWYTAQTLTTEQQTQARQNIGAISAAEAPAPDLTPYLTKTEAQSTYLGKEEKAASSATSDDAQSILQAFIEFAQENGIE